MKHLYNLKLLFYFYLFTVDRVNDFSYKYINLKLHDQSTTCKSTCGKQEKQPNVALNEPKVNLTRQNHYAKRQYAKAGSSPSFTSLEFLDLIDLFDAEEFGANLKRILCNNDLVDNFAYDTDNVDHSSSASRSNKNVDTCLITVVPCGDLNDWHLIDIDQKKTYAVKSKSNNSMLDLTFHGHWELLTNTNDVIDRLNMASNYLRQIDLINLVQEKRLGHAGLYTSNERQNYKSNYLSSSSSYSRKYVFRNNIRMNTCDYLELTIFDSMSNQMVRKQIHRDDF